MRLVLKNPHYCDYGVTVANFFLRRKSFLKYDYFTRYFIKGGDKNIVLLVDIGRTSFSAIGIRFFLAPKLFTWLEIMCWMLINGIPLSFRKKVIFDVSQLDKENDILVDFARLTDSWKFREGGENFSGIKFLFFTHYFLKTKEISESLRLVSNTIVVAENDLLNNGYFRKFFPFVEKTYQLPFTFGRRFVSRIDFSKRKNRCFAIGTICPVESGNEEYHAYFGDLDTIHPMRQKIHDMRKQYLKEIDSYIRPYKSFSLVREIDKRDSRWIRFLRRFAPESLLKALLIRQHNKYFKFDIVQKYNSYQMFVSPEENIGLPSVNVFEGMACGSAFVGIIHPMYSNLGMIPGVHYVGYQENNFDDLIAKIRYYQEHSRDLNEIAKNGQSFVRARFSKRVVADMLWNDLECISQTFFKTKAVAPICSFRKQ